MTTLEQFLNQLEPHPNLELVFILPNGQNVPVGYHVTEFKALEYHTVDCGGMEHKFKENNIELWRTALEPSCEYMRVGKFLSIYNKVSPKVAFDQNAELVFLYGAPGEPAARYAVARLEPQAQQLYVMLEPQGVRCKAAERRADAQLELLPVVGGCCTPTDSSKLCC
ncbi:MAG: DUF6428 family protein [Deinococcales bacterium]